MQILKKLLFLLGPNERQQAGLLLIMIIFMALLDMIGVASILPFVAVLTNPNLIETNNTLNYMFQISRTLGVENDQQFLFSLGVLVFLLLIISLSFKALTNYAQVKFVKMNEFNIGKRLVETYLHQPYSWFLNRHSADLGKTILSETQQIISGGMTPLMELIAKGMVVITLITLLVIADPKLALIIFLLLAGTYAIIFYFVRNYLNRAGKKSLASNQSRFTAVSEAFGAIKEVKAGGFEKNFIKLFSNSAKIFAQTQASAQIIAQLPRFILEIIAFGGILLIILYIMSQTGGLDTALPFISLYVFAGYRLLPALQQCYISFTQLTFVSPSLDKLTDDIKNIKTLDKNLNQKSLSFNENITLNNINYSYPNSTRTALKDINLTIPIKSKIGLIGVTGSGKTTIVDLILGLLEPQKGTLEVDGKIISKHNVRSWQSLIGYVPQQIYLSDETISANIAFCVEPKEIDHAAVQKSAKIANIHNFIIDELPKQYQTTIGDRGIRLSGGQRQRIGLARALYHNPSVIILDEATSALDNQTEKTVMEAMNNLSKNITIIQISHRLNTLKNCDVIFKLEKGQLVKDENLIK
tara:strand:+ start:2886 stop:4634 length:1749 start_codon:yes stop_codon:yes gene_type:complete